MASLGDDPPEITVRDLARGMCVQDDRVTFTVTDSAVYMHMTEEEEAAQRASRRRQR